MAAISPAPAASFPTQRCRRRRCFTAASLPGDGRSRVRPSLVQRRSFVPAGVSSFGLFPLNAGAKDASALEITTASFSGEDFHSEAGSPLITLLLKSIDYLGLCTLGALCVLACLEIEVLKAATSSEEVSLSGELAFAKKVITTLHRELEDERKLAQELLIRICQTEMTIELAKEGKAATEAAIGKKGDSAEVLLHKLDNYRSKGEDKERILEWFKPAVGLKENAIDYGTSASLHGDTEEELEIPISKIRDLEQDVFRKKESVEDQKALVDEHNEKSKILLAERDDCFDRLHLLEQEYLAFKASAEEKTRAHLNLLSEKDVGLAHLQEKLDLALNDGTVTRMQLTDLETERDNLFLRLKTEIEYVKYLNDELQWIKATLADSRLQIAGLLTELEQSETNCEDRSSDSSRTTSTIIEKDHFLEASLDGAKMSVQMLSYELSTVKDNLDETIKELCLMSYDLKIAKKNHENLKKKLLKSQKKVETSVEDLEEERMMVSCLNKEIEALREQLVMSIDARKKLGLDLKEAIKLLNEMNKNASAISCEFESIKRRCVSVEAANNMLHKILNDVKDAIGKTMTNLDDAENLISKLANDTEVLGKREKKLEEDLASAKGEILLLRRRMRATGSTSKKKPDNGRKRSNRKKKREPAAGVTEKSGFE